MVGNNILLLIDINRGNVATGYHNFMIYHHMGWSDNRQPNTLTLERIDLLNLVATLMATSFDL